MTSQNYSLYRYYYYYRSFSAEKDGREVAGCLDALII